jgi:hypothetical protein
MKIERSNSAFVEEANATPGKGYGSHPSHLFCWFWGFRLVIHYFANVSNPK